MNVLPEQQSLWQKAKEISKALFFSPKLYATQREPENLEKQLNISLALEKQNLKFKQSLEETRQKFELARLKLQYLQDLDETNLLTRQNQVNFQINQELREYIQNIKQAPLTPAKDFEQFLGSHKAKTEQEFNKYYNEFSLLIALAQAEISRGLKDYQRVLSDYPWNFDPKAILDEYSQYFLDKGKIPPLVIISTPNIENNKFTHPPSNLSYWETSIAENLRNFFYNNYSQSDETQPTYLASGSWDDKQMRSETSSKLLFYLFKNIPLIILSSEIYEDNINLSMACWDVGIDYLYKPIISNFSYKDFLNLEAKEAAKQWEKEKNELLAKGISHEKIIQNVREQENEYNLAIWQEEKKLKSRGLKITLDYKPTQAGIEKFANYWSLLSCICASLATDAYYFIRYGEQPKLPKLLPLLTQDLSELESEFLVNIILDYYQIFSQELNEIAQINLQYFYLELAFDFKNLSDKNFAKKQIEKSLEAFLKDRNLNVGINLFDSIAKIEEVLQLEDRPYVDKVNQCLDALSVFRKIRLGEAYYREGVKYFEAKQYQEAIAYLDNAINQGYLQAQVKRDLASRALKTYEDQERKRRKDAELLETQGDNYLALGNETQALWYYEQAFASGSSSAEVKINELKNKQLTNQVELAENFQDEDFEIPEVLEEIEQIQEIENAFVDELPVKVDRSSPLTELLEIQPTEEQTNILDLGNGVFLKLVNIPAGSFKMQGDHEINLQSFLMGQLPVTQQQYREIMGENPSAFIDDHKPVERVSWYEAVEFCRKVSEKTGQQVRLPSEAEWEYAACAGKSEKLFFDEQELKDYAWFVKNSGQTHKVGEKKPNPWGLYDILGNVWEWCLDDWESNYLMLPKDGSAFKKNAEKRSRRGASWLNYAGYCHCHFRLWYNPEYKHNSIGLRVIVEN